MEQPNLVGQDIRLTFIHTSDIHSRLFPYNFVPNVFDRGYGLTTPPFGGISRMTSVVKQIRSESRRSLWLDSGDCFQGAPVFNMFKGEAEMRALSVAGMDGAVLGNHEFELVSKNLFDKIDNWATYPLLAGNPAWERSFAGGTFATIYLAPYNYHRIHMPIAGELRECFYVPGRLFSVNRTTAQLVPGLFAINERVVCGFDSAGMPWGLILVGALNVGSMATVWHGDVTPRKHREVTALPVTEVLAPTALDKAAEMGRFNMGSTVILLFPPRAVEWQATLAAGRVLRVGERIGTLRSWP
jgi:phosphatidylserine decarboxylase precursor